MDDKDLDDILNDPIFEITETEKSLFSLLQELRVKRKRDKSEYLGRRKPCEDFHLYEHLFQQVHRELNEGKRVLLRYSEKSMKAGGFFIENGVMVYLAETIDVKQSDRSKHKDGRTRLIYENGMESDIKFRTFGKNLQKDGYIISESSDEDYKALEAFNINDADKPSGWIYVLRSLSTNSEIVNQQHLYKIGYSENPIEVRIKNARNEPTYLMDDVEVVASWQTYNMNTNRLEVLIHKVFSAVNFRFKVFDNTGAEHKATEWYVVPYSIIKSVVEHIIRGTITEYRYNSQLQVLEKVERKNDRIQSQSIDTEGWSVLSLIIKEVYFKEILSGNKTIEYRELKQSKIFSYTWVEKETGTRYLKKFDALRLYVGYHKDRESALVEVVDTTYDVENQTVEYHLGKVLEVNLKS
jgi:hypothetical protein